MSDRPEFGDVVDDDSLTPAEAERYRRVHDLLVSAGPPPDLPAALVEAPALRGRVIALSPRRIAAAASAAAALAAAAFALGFLVADQRPGFETSRGPVVMRGNSDAAIATLRIGRVDAGGNWPVLLEVSGLPPLTLPGATYELVLVRENELGPTCGSFVVDGETTEVAMNVPWNLRRWSGWVIVRRDPGTPPSEPLLST